MLTAPRYFSFKARESSLYNRTQINLDLDETNQNMSNVLEFQNDFTFKKARHVLAGRQKIKDSYQ